MDSEANIIYSKFKKNSRTLDPSQVTKKPRTAAWFWTQLVFGKNGKKMEFVFWTQLVF